MLKRFEKLVPVEFDLLPLSRDEFRAAADLCRSSARNLRAGNALYLAVARSHALTLCTRDIRLAAAGTALGSATKVVGPTG